MGPIDETLERARALARERLPACFELRDVELAFGFGETDAFVVDVAYRRRSADLEPWGWEAGLIREIRRLVSPDVWIGFREEVVPGPRDADWLDGSWIILDEE